MPRLALLCLLSGAALLHAQEYRSTLTGRITDPSGSPVPNVKVTATKTDTNTPFRGVTGPEGLYTIPQLPPGPYELAAEASGFKKYVQSGIELASNLHVAVDVTLTIGAASESVTVTADAPALETERASSGQAITTREVENLPINGRAPMDLAVMAYAVVNTGVRDQNRPYENGGFSDFAMGGAVSGANEALLDGVPNTGTLGTTGRRAAFSPPVDAVSEVKVEVLNVDAAYGGAGGGTIEVITKGGTNLLHGTASEFNQVSNLTATPFFTNKSGGRKTIFRQNTWGMTAGGPLWVPKVYDGRNKVFWFFTYEGHRNSEPAPYYMTVPTDAERKGDFSSLLALGAGYQLYDPGTGRLSGSTVTRTPFAGNLIPTNRLNGVAQNWLKFVPSPNNVAAKPDGTNNYFTGLSNQNKYWAYSGRMDANLSSRNRINGRVSDSLWRQDAGNIFNNSLIGQAGLRAIWSATVDDIHTFSPTVVGDLRVGFTRYRAYYILNSDGYDPTQLGFPSYIASNATKLFMPQFNFPDGFFVASPAINVNTTDQPNNTYQVFGSVTKIAGRHSLKFGGEHRVFDYSNIAWTNGTGTYTFDSNWVRSSSTAAGQAVGGNFASFLLGLPTSGAYVINASSKNDSKYEVAFVQHDWHARPNLTLNMGVRWEYNSGTTERWNRQVVGFDPAAVNSSTAPARAAYANIPNTSGLLLPASQFVPTGGLIFASPDRRAQSDPPKTNFSPRLGISWSPAALKNKTVIRSGMGIFDYVYGVVAAQQPGFSATNTYVATNDSYLTPAATLSDPFPAANPLKQPVGAALGVNTNLGQSVTFLNPQLGRQYSLRWTFDVQQQLTKNTTLQVGYVGNHSVHLTTNYNFGSLPAQYLSKSLVRDQNTINALGALVTNPFLNLLPGTGLNGSTTALSNLLKPFPEFTGVTENAMNNGGSYFHEVAVRLYKRLSQGVILSVNYSHSRLMERTTYPNASDLTLEKRVSVGDRPNNFTLSALYELPFGKGKRYFSGARGIVNVIVGNWAISELYNYHTGAPVAWGNMLYYWGDLNYSPRNTDRAFDVTRFNLVSAQQLASNFRYFPTQFNNVRVDGTNNLNLTVTKDFSFGEKLRLQFRGESFNVGNHALFAAPNVTPTSGAFGTITSQTNTPRVIQFALRLIF
ncbi:MAG: carboxypeptidase-like regulatory domain-containing protein [Candidatus Solibacter sp.]|nr:carboxypeptidase-like regulatory domain-containing protein [Candidatus Solibacter sp.]